MKYYKIIKYRLFCNLVLNKFDKKQKEAENHSRNDLYNNN